jgi:hypothetical protein
MNVTFDNVGGLDNRKLTLNRDQVQELMGRYQSIERNGCSTSSLSGTVSAIRHYTTQGCLIPRSAWYRYVPHHSFYIT